MEGFLLLLAVFVVIYLENKEYRDAVARRKKRDQQFKKIYKK